MGDSRKIGNGLHAFAEEWIGQVLGEELDGGPASDGIGDFTSPVEDFDGRRVGRWSIRRELDLGDIGALFEHAKRCTKGQVANNVECDVVEPLESVEFGVLALAGLLVDLVPSLGQQLEVVVHVLLELANRLGAEGVGDGLALAGVFMSISGVEQAALDGNKGIVVFRLEEAGAVAVDDGNGIGIGNGDVVGLHTDELAELLVQVIDGQVASGATALVHVPEVGEFGQEGAGDVVDGPVAEVGQHIEQHGHDQKGPWGEQERQEHGGGGGGGGAEKRGMWGGKGDIQALAQALVLV